MRYKCKTYSSYIGNDQLEQSFLLPSPVDKSLSHRIGTQLELCLSICSTILFHCYPIAVIYGLVKKVQAVVPALPNCRLGAQPGVVVRDLVLEI